MKIKTLYSFEVNKEIEKEVKEKSKDKDGNEITISKKVIENEPVTFSIRKPNRKLYEEAELFFAVKLSEGIKAGLLTQALLAKRYKNDGGPMSDAEKKRYAEIYYDMLIKQEELEKLKLNLNKDPEEERARKASTIMTDVMELQQEIQHFESSQSSLFDNTAENRAKNMSIMWWVLNLSFRKQDDVHHENVFAGRTYEDQLDSYDALEEEGDAFWTEVIKKFAYFVTFWYLNGLSTKEEFKQIENIYQQGEGDDEDEVEEVKDETEEEVETEMKEAEEEAKAEEKAKVKEEAKTKEAVKETKAEEVVEEVVEETKAEEVVEEVETEAPAKKPKRKPRAKKKQPEKQDA